MKRILIVAGMILFVAVGAAWWYVFHTAAGLSFVLARIGNLKTIGITAEGVAGTLAGPLTLERITVDHKVARIVVEKVVLELSPHSLFAQRVQIDSITAERASVEVKPSAESDAKPPRFFPSLLMLAVDQADLKDVRVFSTNESFNQTAKRVRGSLKLTAKRLQVSDLLVDGPFYSGGGSVAVRAVRPIELKIDTQMRVPAPRGPAFDVLMTLSGPISKLHLSADLVAPSKARFDGDILRGDRSWQVLGHLSSDRFLLNPWLERPAFSLTDIAIKVDAAPEEIRAVGQVTSPELDALPLGIDFRGRYSGRVIAITRGEIRPSQSGTRIATAARIDMTERRPVIAATAEWTDFHWPLREHYFVSPQGQLSLFGAFPFTLGVNADVRTAPPGIDPIAGHFSAHGELSDTAIDFDELTLLALDGQVKGAARLGLTPKREWRVDVAAAHLNPQGVSKELPGQINFNVNARGAGLDKKADFAITLPTLEGTLRGEPLHGRGYVSHDARGWSTREFSISLGTSRFAANGEWREKIDLAWSLEIPALERFMKTAKGSVQFSGTAHGSKTRPQIAGSLIADKLSYGQWNAASLRIAGNVDSSDRLTSSFTVDAERLGFGERRISELRIKAEGKASAHTVDIHAETKPNGTISNVSTRLQGAYADESWRGQIAPLMLADDAKQAPTISAAAAPVLFSKDAIRIDALCALWTDRKACASGNWSKRDGWRVDVQSDPLPLSMFNGTFPEDSRYQGQWQMNAHFVGALNKPWTGTSSIQVSEASLAYQPIAGAEEIVKLGSGQVEAMADATRFAATLRIVTPGTTNIDATARIERSPAFDFAVAPLNGELRAHTADANLLPLFFPDLDHSAGELNLQLSATGTPSNPLVQGTIDLHKGELDLYRYNLSMRELSATARIADNRLGLNGQAKLGAGTLAMNGDFLWHGPDTSGTLHLQGENLLVANLPEYRIVASPNVDFKIDGKRVDVRGEVVIPSAHIEPTDLRGAVQISNDVRLVGERPGESMRGFDVHSEVNVRMGDDVRLETYGLQGKLGGAVMVVTGDESAIGRGELNVADGRYEAYGQKLEIARGRLLFDASPLDNPGLDIQAARQIEERRVGVNVRGTLRAPRVTLFAEPALPQSQIVSMLLTGKPIADLSTRDTTAVGAVQDDLRLQGGSVLASQIGRRIGLEEVGVESTGLNDASLVLGKFLSPRLFVSYGISLTESINTLKLRYTISKSWRIKTEAGQNQSADVEYRIER